jgi:vanillate O-demethylase ferredoxin subunit
MPQPPDTLNLRVAARRAIADEVVELELRSIDNAQLPGFEPGAHIDVHLANGMVRQYSLANYQPAPDSYTIAVGLAVASRGGSKHIHESIAVGDLLPVSLPRNSFPLDPAAAGYVFIAGGIGITPIMSMVRWCEMSRTPWRLLYSARSRQRAAYAEQLAALGGERVHLHFDDITGSFADLDNYLAKLRAEDQVYCCGPEPLMQAVGRAAAHHPASHVRFEHFSVVPTDAPSLNHAFTVRLTQSARDLPVPADISILDALDLAGIAHPFGCREGLCRSCEAEVCGGIPDHRDFVLSDEERAANRSIMVCVSRSKSDCLELKL